MVIVASAPSPTNSAIASRGDSAEAWQSPYPYIFQDHEGDRFVATALRDDIKRKFVKLVGLNMWEKVKLNQYEKDLSKRRLLMVQAISHLQSNKDSHPDDAHEPSVRLVASAWERFYNPSSWR